GDYDSRGSLQAHIDSQNLRFGTCLGAMFGLRRSGIFQPQEILLSHWIELQKVQLGPHLPPQISLYELGPPESA
ncbi:unnamed protein product, partial [Amoebophrya sp. A25]